MSKAVLLWYNFNFDDKLCFCLGGQESLPVCSHTSAVCEGKKRVLEVGEE